MMKKYFGKEMWVDTIYFAEVLPPGEENEEYSETFIIPVCGYETPKDMNIFPGDKNNFEDTNDFITFTEIFNIFQTGKI